MSRKERGDIIVENGGKSNILISAVKETDPDRLA